jgi:hypothetical protein
MTLQEMVCALLERGLTQDNLRDKVKERGINCSQTQISRITRGHDVRYQLGSVLRDIYIAELEAVDTEEEEG